MDDAAFMRRALRLARRGWGSTAPNPMVGAVVVRDGEIVTEGWHARYGGPHAEAAALAAAGDRARGATVYVTLEPCNHHGKTPPCSDALIAAGVRRVVVAAEDPHPVAAGGAKKLRAHGIEVVTGVEREAARELNAPFFHALASDRPWVVLKLALSLDGAVADDTRRPGWLTGRAARREVHRLRAGSDAVAVGIGTALADDPELTVRDASAPRVPPLRVVFDRSARLPDVSRLVRTARDVPTAVVVSPHTPAARLNDLEGAGVRVVRAATLHDALRALRADHDVRSLLVEGGAGLASALWTAGLVDRLITFQAPVVLGRGALPAFGDVPAARAEAARRLPIVARRAFGDDLMTIYAVHTLESR
ncbi:riboflavin biosynthesis protein RibD [Gemmatirosa kalamazoonensis]|uniref:Riboflavin biosynthesis protein RibD n=1 Tax=Gemmatirosa kalamazoonensis TaxID=861299 RepID=W0RIN5_9BACT|nr:bifunctional diaminohydroxyphosphoribosylaminopyrimidine deaminase/5-amino-6-(5-phosphoribosylamino)uracil reductase RibD [Gemmatirosa kalamazoonensis]AHG90651.1 riboflavin biosynthesis protein RibD [Gemmatirosa kalamazoonensis]